MKQNILIFGLGFCIFLYSFTLNNERSQNIKHQYTNQLIIDSLVLEIHYQEIEKCKYQEKEQKILFFWNTIGAIESANNNLLIGDNGKALGSYQIHNIAVLDVNRLYGTAFTHSQMLNDSLARSFGELYLNKGCELYFNKYGKLPDMKVLVNYWNFGIYQTQYNNGYYAKFTKQIKNNQ